MNAGVVLVDSHCHLMLEQFDDDLPATVERARAAGVGRILIPGIDLATSRRAVELAENTPGLFAAVGVHPNRATSWNGGAAEELESLAQSPSVLAIGEIGLDFYRQNSPREVQERVFETQLDLARALELPIVVHLRESVEQIVRRVSAWAADLPSSLAGRAGVLHAFSGDGDQGLRAVENGFYLGVAGPITYRNAYRRREITRHLPDKALLVETDAPYMSPEPHRGQRNEPARVRLVAERLAQLKGKTLPEVAAQTTNNANCLFEWDHGTSNRNLL